MTIYFSISKVEYCKSVLFCIQWGSQFMICVDQYLLHYDIYHPCQCLIIINGCHNLHIEGFLCMITLDYRASWSPTKSADKQHLCCYVMVLVMQCSTLKLQCHFTFIRAHYRMTLAVIWINLSLLVFDSWLRRLSVWKLWLCM